MINLTLLFTGGLLGYHTILEDVLWQKCCWHLLPRHYQWPFSRKSNDSYAMLNSLGDSFKRKKELNNIILEVNLLLYCEYHVAHFQN
jgi:hypothetical protein